MGYEVSANAEKNKDSWKEYKKDEGFMLHSHYRLNGEDQKVLELPDVQTEKIRIQIIDVHGNITWRRFDLSENSEQLPENP